MAMARLNWLACIAYIEPTDTRASAEALPSPAASNSPSRRGVATRVVARNRTKFAVPAAPVRVDTSKPVRLRLRDCRPKRGAGWLSVRRSSPRFTVHGVFSELVLADLSDIWQTRPGATYARVPTPLERC
jgi:hypothetical protein